MERSHLYMPLVDSSGETYSYAEVILLDSDTGKPIDEPVYLDPNGGAPQPWPVLIDPAVINFWTDTPLRVTVQAALPGGATFTRAGVDIAPPPSGTVRTREPLRIGSAAGLDGSAMLAVSPDGTAAWQVLDVLRFHRHEGDSPNSTVLAPNSPSDIYAAQTWLGRNIGGTQGPNSTAAGADAQVSGPHATALGRGTATAEGVALGADAVAGPSAVAAGAGADASAQEQVALGRRAKAAPHPGAVVLGGGVTAAADEDIRLGNSITVKADGTVVIGQGEVAADWLPSSEPHVALLGKTVMGRYVRAMADVVLGGAAATLGFYGAAGTARPILSTAGVSTSTPGRTALLSLLSALDQLGLIYLIDGAIDDELVDWTKSAAHSASMGLETGDADNSKAGDLNRAKRNDVGPGTITYQRATDIKDFALRAFTWYQAWNPDNHANEITVSVSPDSTIWTPIRLDWAPLVPTAADWNQAWVRNARPIPAGMRYLRVQLDMNSLSWTPQIGRVIVR
ncbi:hypothetical protein ABZS76_33300 [Streptomyces sp. NPDC005562]|uniref:hypothetical protein n=1 Tax=Streptomyces sp. NPDC005562 TaxID=3154890 RepID=UPI0033BD10F1